MTSKLIYLATPYTNLSSAERLKSITKIMQFIFSRFENQKEVIYSPILHSHFMVVEMEMNSDWQYWLNHNLTILARCDELWILCIEGWNESTGIEKEIIFSLENNIKVEYIYP